MPNKANRILESIKGYAGIEVLTLNEPVVGEVTEQDGFLARCNGGHMQGCNHRLSENGIVG